MKIESGRGVGSATGPKRAGGTTAAPGFAPSVEGAAPTSSASSVSSVMPLDAIIALQSDEPPAQRRRRQAKRGQDALNALEDLERGLLAGRAPAALKAQLESLHFAAAPTGEAGLDDVLREIDIRLAVEIAKLERVLAA